MRTSTKQRKPFDKRCEIGAHFRLLSSALNVTSIQIIVKIKKFKCLNEDHYFNIRF